MPSPNDCSNEALLLRMHGDCLLSAATELDAIGAVPDPHDVLCRVLEKVCLVLDELPAVKQAIEAKKNATAP